MAMAKRNGDATEKKKDDTKNRDKEKRNPALSFHAATIKAEPAMYMR
jgi:hypothetical protein